MKYFLWSDIPKDYHVSTKPDAERHAKEGRVLQVTSNADLISIFRGIRKSGNKIDELTFYTHGAKGEIRLGSDHVDWIVLRDRFSPEQFQDIFAPGCVITFEGCNVAESAVGEYFLVMVGKTFLLNGGGKVYGNTGVGWGALGNIHPFGDWVGAFVNTGGGTALGGEKHLDVPKIKQRARSARSKFDQWKTKFPAATKTDLQSQLDNADYYAFGADTWWNNFQACLWLDVLERNLDAAVLSVNRAWARPG